MQFSLMTKQGEKTKDYLYPQLAELPYFRALLRAVEARFYEDIVFPTPVLDVGCGDATFAKHAFDPVPDVGIDPWLLPLKTARRAGLYPHLLQADGAHMPFPDQFFASAVSNSVLEHIPQLDDVLLELARVLKPGALFVFCVPNDRFLDTLSIGRGLDRLRLRSAANAYRRFFNRISRHHHCDSPDVWTARMDSAGFAIEDWWHYFSPAAFRVLEWGHYFGLPSAVAQALTRRWILAPKRWNLGLTERFLRPYYESPGGEKDGVYTFYIARRR